MSDKEEMMEKDDDDKYLGIGCFFITISYFIISISVMGMLKFFDYYPKYNPINYVQAYFKPEINIYTYCTDSYYTHDQQNACMENQKEWKKTLDIVWERSSFVEKQICSSGNRRSYGYDLFARCLLWHYSERDPSSFNRLKDQIRTE